MKLHTTNHQKKTTIYDFPELWYPTSYQLRYDIFNHPIGYDVLDDKYRKRYTRITTNGETANITYSYIDNTLISTICFDDKNRMMYHETEYEIQYHFYPDGNSQWCNKIVNIQKNNNGVSSASLHYYDENDKPKTVYQNGTSYKIK